MSIPQRLRTRDRGFSLMELMVVIAILGILSTLVVRNVIPMIGRAKVNTAKSDIATLKDAVQHYLMNNNKLPDSLDALIAPDPKNGNGSYIEQEETPRDPWDNEYQYIKEGSNKFEIKSYGADGLEGGEGDDEDISSKKLKSSSGPPSGG